MSIEKKGKGSKPSEMIRGLRKALWMKQDAFARALGIARSLVATCEADHRIPTTDMYLRLGNFAVDKKFYFDAIWFWEQAGLDSSRILAVAGHILRERGLHLSPEQLVYVPQMEFPGHEVDLETAARILAVSTQDVLRLARRGEVTSRRLGKFPTFDFTSIAKYVTRRRELTERKESKKRRRHP